MESAGEHFVPIFFFFIFFFNFGVDLSLLFLNFVDDHLFLVLLHCKFLGLNCLLDGLLNILLVLFYLFYVLFGDVSLPSIVFIFVSMRFVVYNCVIFPYFLHLLQFPHSGCMIHHCLWDQLLLCQFVEVSKCVDGSFFVLRQGFLLLGVDPS